MELILMNVLLYEYLLEDLNKSKTWHKNSNKAIK